MRTVSSVMLRMTAVIWACTASASALAADAPIAPAVEPGSEVSHGQFLEVDETPGRRVALRIATRTYAPAEGEGPVIALVGVTHVGNAAFYTAIEKHLREYDIVLFEGVGPPGSRPAVGDTTKQRILRTRESLQLLASIIQGHFERFESYPAGLDAVGEYIDTLDPLVRNWGRRALTDAWGNSVRYELAEDGASFAVRSDGPKAAPNDESDDEAAETLVVYSEDAGVIALLPDESNIQKQLASALGLAYQLDSLPYENEHWRGSDMHARDLAAAFRAEGADMDVLAPMTGGASFPARVAQFLLRMVSFLDTMAEGAVSDVLKVLMIELLGDAELIAASMGQLGEGFEKVIVGRRNQVVMDDLARIRRDEPQIRSIAVLYGAAHMADMVERLEEQIQYEEVGEPHWFDAITVDLTQSRLNPAQIERMRGMVRRMLRQQIAR